MQRKTIFVAIMLLSMLHAIPWQAIVSIEDGTIKLKPGFRVQKGK